MAKKKNTKYSFVNDLHEKLGSVLTVTRSGEVRVKRTDLKNLVEGCFVDGIKAACRGERVRFPVIGALVRKDVPPRKGGKGVNPFTGQPMTVKPRTASKKPRWSFPKSLRESFANKKNW